MTRTTIDDKRRMFPTERTLKATKERGSCAYCGHHKLLEGAGPLRCAKCKRRVHE